METDKNSKTLKWRYKPSKRDQNNTTRKLIFEKYYVDVNVTISFPEKPFEVLGFLDELFLLAGTRLKADGLTSEAIEPSGTFPEGKRVERLHYVRERNPKVARLAKQRFKDEKGRIFCEACDFDFQETYGEDYIEAHHILPLGEIKEESVRKSVAHLNFIIDNQLFIKGVPHLIEHSLKEGQIETKIEDIVLLCCNCHKMVHKKRPWLKSIEEIKSLLFKDSRLKILG